MSPLVLLVDDYVPFRRAIARRLRRSHEVVEADNGALALDVVRQRPRIHCLVTDMDMPVMDGLALIRALLHAGESLAHRAVIVTADPDGARTAIKNVPAEIPVFEKHCAFEDLEAAIRRAATSLAP